MLTSILLNAVLFAASPCPAARIVVSLDSHETAEVGASRRPRKIRLALEGEAPPRTHRRRIRTDLDKRERLTTAHVPRRIRTNLDD